VIPSMEHYGLGYTFHLENSSIGRQDTINDLYRISVNPIPYRFLKGLKIEKINTSEQITNNNEILMKGSTSIEGLMVEHPNPSYYQITINNQQITDNSTLVLSQSFDKGWKAYEIGCQSAGRRISCLLQKALPFIFGRELKDHVLVNNWENGWNISENKQQITDNKNQTIIIMYLPQLMEYLGFAMLLFIPLIIYRTKS
jgi:hypothetical protein